MPHVAISAIGADRPGIVAAVTGVLMDHGCNLEDTTMSILRGHFAMMLVVAVPPEYTTEALEQALAGPASALDLVVVVRAIDDDVPASPQGRSFTVSVYGADRPGIVHRVTSTLATEGANIVDLATRVIGGSEHPVYAMFLDVTIPSERDPATIEDRLSGLAGELGISCTMHEADADVL